MSWELTSLGALIEVLSGFAFDSKKFSDFNGKPLIRIRDIKRSYTETFYNGNFDEKYIVKSGDVLIGMDGEFNVAEWNGTDALLNQRVCKVSVKKPNLLDLRYLLYFLPYELKLIEDKASFVTVKHLSVNDIKNIQIPLPPLATQKRIAEILDAADALRRKDQELLKKYDELAQAIFIDMFGDPVKNEKGWEVKKLKDVCNKITDGTHFSPPNCKEGVPYITAKHLKQDYIDFHSNPTYISQKHHEEIFSRCTPVKSDVLYIKDGATTGIAAVNEYEFEFSMLSSLALIKPNKNNLNSYYLASYLNNYIVKQELIRSYMAGAAIKRFTLDKINKFEIVLPPIEMQNFFEQKWKSLRNCVTYVKNSKADNLFQTLIQKAFKGELV
jgi:type I restriction enzyme S subunit